MPKPSHGEDLRDWVSGLLEVLLTCAEKESWEREGIDCTWQHENTDRPELVVITENRFLLPLVTKSGDKEATVDKKLRTAVNYYLGQKFLGILTDNRGDKTQGSPELRFTLKLWSKTDKQKNLAEFKQLWAVCRQAKIKRREKPKPSDTPPFLEIQPPSNVLKGIRDPKFFVGRGEELKDLHELLQERGQVMIAAVSGMGGLGKTELAIQYAKQYRHEYLKGICWLQAGEEQNIPTQVVNFTLEIFPSFVVNRDLPPENQVRSCWRQWLNAANSGHQQSGQEKMLVIVDDVTDYEQVAPYLPPEGQRIRVIFTTRWELEGANIVKLALKVLEPKAAIKLLKLLVGKDRIQSQEADAKRLCEWMEYLPLGLELVGQYLKKESHLSLAEMLLVLQDRGLKHQAMLRQQGKPWLLTAERGVAAAFDLSWEKLDHETRRLGCLLSLFAAAPIPWQLVELAEQKRGAECEEAFNRESLEMARGNLRELHLLQEAGVGVYRLHQLIRRFFREKLGEGE
jgi:hypothetical protein